MSQSTKTGTTFGAEQSLSQSSSIRSAKVGSKRSINVSSSSEKIQSKKLKKWKLILRAIFIFNEEKNQVKKKF